MKRWLGAILTIMLFAAVMGGLTAWAAPESGVLMVDAPMTQEEFTVLGSDIPRSSVVSVTFLDALTDAPADAWDVSGAKDGSVKAWTDRESGMYKLYIAAEGGVRAGQYSAGLFQGYTALERINFNGCFDTGGAISMEAMFKECASLTGLDLTGFETAQAAFMDDMFYGCAALESIQVGKGFVVPDGTDLERMFQGCPAQLVRMDAEVKNGDSRILRSDAMTKEERENKTGRVLGSDIPRSQIATVTFVDSLSGMASGAWDVSAAGDGSVMAWVKPNGGLYDLYIGADGTVLAGPDTCRQLFKDYTSVKSIRFDGAFDTSGAENMQMMFAYCSLLTEVDLSGLNTSKVRNMESMFYDCQQVKELHVTGFDTSSVETMRTMFYNCAALKQLDVSRFETGRVTDMAYMFRGCALMKELDVSGFDTSSAETMQEMFYECSALDELDVSGFDTGKVTNMAHMFYRCGELDELDVSGFDTADVTTMKAMFCECSDLKKLDVSGFNTSSAENMNSMFYNCGALDELDVSGFDTGKVTDMSFLFYGCTELDELDVSGFDTADVTTMKAMFYECSDLKKLDVSRFDTGKVTDMSFMFYGCTGLKALDVSEFDTDDVTNMYAMFYKCEKVTKLDVSGFDTDRVTNMAFMFCGCQSLEALDLSGFNVRNVTDFTSVLADNNKLARVIMPDGTEMSGLVSLGMSGEAVRKAQQRLIAKGFLNGNADGVFGQGTEAAVKAFQKSIGLKESGVVDGGTMVALFS
ncbi:MAG: BspA family leucine-rich repeat surface protein [Clostridia bacterium]|nr:BspA family leucine-rich repeat surface protein [Clostridia bacterium]